MDDVQAITSLTADAGFRVAQAAMPNTLFLCNARQRVNSSFDLRMARYSSHVTCPEIAQTTANSGTSTRINQDNLNL